MDWGTGLEVEGFHGAFAFIAEKVLGTSGGSQVFVVTRVLGDFDVPLAGGTAGGWEVEGEGGAIGGGVDVHVLVIVDATNDGGWSASSHSYGELIGVTLTATANFLSSSGFDFTEKGFGDGVSGGGGSSNLEAGEIQSHLADIAAAFADFSVTGPGAGSITLWIKSKES